MCGRTREWKGPYRTVFGSGYQSEEEFIANIERAFVSCTTCRKVKSGARSRIRPKNLLATTAAEMVRHVPSKS
jgi:hypothetical protein